MHLKMSFEFWYLFRSGLGVSTHVIIMTIAKFLGCLQVVVYPSLKHNLVVKHITTIFLGNEWEFLEVKPHIMTSSNVTLIGDPGIPL